MAYVVQEQHARTEAPRRGECIALTVDATTSAYPLGSLALSGFTPEGDAVRRNEVFVTLRAITADVWFYFSNGSSTALDNTAAVADGGTLAYADTYGWMIPAGQESRMLIDRSRDTHLVVKTSSGTATLLIRASSHAMG